MGRVHHRVVEAKLGLVSMTVKIWVAETSWWRWSTRTDGRWQWSSGELWRKAMEHWIGIVERSAGCELSLWC